MGKHTDIFPADLGQRPSSEIGTIVLHALSLQPGCPTLEEGIDAFQHVFETAADRTQRELDVFLAYVPLLVDRIARRAHELNKAGDRPEADALRRQAFPMLKAVARLENLVASR
jgi:hypothetical protein